MGKKLYYLGLNHLTAAITKGQYISPTNLFDFDDYNKNIDEYILAHLSLSYLITSEHIHEEMLPEAIKQAFMEYSPDKNKCCDRDNYIDTQSIKDYLSYFINEEGKNGASIFHQNGISYDAFKKNLEAIMNVMIQYIAYNNTSDVHNSKYARILQAYLPCIIFSFITNYTNRLNDSICQTTKSMGNKRAVKHVIESLTQPSANISVSGKKVREITEIIYKSTKVYKYTTLYNYILHSCQKSNYSLAFIWFERNVGAYQFYLKYNEYTKIINHICEYKPHNKFRELNIEKSIAIYKTLISGYKFDNDDAFMNTLDCLNTEENCPILTCLCKALSNISSLDDVTGKYLEILENNPTKENLKKRIQDFFVEKKKDKAVQRFSVTLINFIFFNDIWNRENFAVFNPKYLFRCKSIQSRLYEMNDVVFNLWLVDRNADCPPDFEKVTYSTDLDLLCPLEPVTINTVNIPECIISVKEAKSVFINCKKFPHKNGMYHLKQADFNELSVEMKPDSLDPLFRHSAWTELYYKINMMKKEKPVSFRLKYYFDHPGQEMSTSVQNIVKCIVNWPSDTDNAAAVRDHKASMNYWDTINKSMRDYIGTCSGDNYSNNCCRASALCSVTQRSTVLDPEYAYEFYRELSKKYSAINHSIPVTDKLTQITNVAYTDEISTDYRNSHMMDIYYPLGAKKDLYPVIVTINGEYWFYNEKNSYSSYGKYLAAKGFAVVNFDYCLAPKYKYPRGFIDVCSLMNHIAANAKKYKLDMKHLYVIGNSAGAQLASQYAILATNPEYKDLFPEASKLESPVPKKLALNCGIYEFDDNIPYLNWYMPSIHLKTSAENILSYINKSFPETFIAVSVNDPLCSASDVMIEKLKGFKIPYVFHQYGLLDESVTNDFWFDVTSEVGKVCSDEEVNFFMTDYLKYYM